MNIQNVTKDLQVSAAGMTLYMLYLKLSAFIDWSWGWVFWPMWVEITLSVVLRFAVHLRFGSDE